MAHLATIRTEIASPQEPGRAPVPLVVPAVSLAPTGRLPFAVQAADASDQPPAGTWSELASDDPEDRAFCAALDAISATLAAAADTESTRLALQTAVNLYAGEAATASMATSPAVAAWSEQLDDFLADQDDPDAAFHAVHAAVKQVACPDWCVNRSESAHTEHVSAANALRLPDTKQPYLATQLVRTGGERSGIAFAGAVLTPDQARAEAAKLQALASTLNNLAACVAAEAPRT